jgi:hypothetical protein
MALEPLDMPAAEVPQWLRGKRCARGDPTRSGKTGREVAMCRGSRFACWRSSRCPRIKRECLTAGSDPMATVAW